MPGAGSARKHLVEQVCSIRRAMPMGGVGWLIVEGGGMGLGNYGGGGGGGGRYGVRGVL